MDKRKMAVRVRGVLRAAGFDAARLTISGYALRANRNVESLQPGFRIEMPSGGGILIRYEPQPWHRRNAKLRQDYAAKYAAALAADGIAANVNGDAAVIE